MTAPKRKKTPAILVSKDRPSHTACLYDRCAGTKASVVSSCAEGGTAAALGHSSASEYGLSCKPHELGDKTWVKRRHSWCQSSVHCTIPDHLLEGSEGSWLSAQWRGQGREGSEGSKGMDLLQSYPLASGIIAQFAFSDHYVPFTNVPHHLEWLLHN